MGADPFADDTGLALVTRDGLVILSGCAHAGICSTVAQAQRLTGDDRLGATASFIAALAPVAFHLCHCTDHATRCAFAWAVPIGEVGVGLVLEYA